jgi:segregation and condensation protein B
VNVEPDRLAILEALLFVAEEPLPLSKLQEILADAASAETDGSLRDLAVRLESDGRGLMVQEVAGGFRLTTRPDVHAWVQKLQQVKPARLSRAALETLAIIAYRQPITRAEIEAIRGVAVDGVLRTLLERELVRMMGRKAEAGRPMLYGTSQQFLEHFGLRELGDLPTLREINELIGITEPGAEIDAPAESTPPIADRPAISDEREPIEEPERFADGPAAASAGAALPIDDPTAATEWGTDRGAGENLRPDGRSGAATSDAGVAPAGASEGQSSSST